MNRMSLEISDGLMVLRRQLAEYTHDGVVMSGDEVRALTDVLKTLTLAARKLENEVSRQRWNQAARLERLADEQIVTAEALRPGTNLRLFPPAFRPFSDGHRPGGAA